MAAAAGAVTVDSNDDNNDDDGDNDGSGGNGGGSGGKRNSNGGDAVESVINIDGDGAAVAAAS